jgi:uncharacterized protein YcaQ
VLREKYECLHFRPNPVYPMKQKSEEHIMSEEIRRAIRELSKNVEKNTPRIRRTLAKRGKKADPVLVFIGAQYLDCLTRLAKE